MARQFYEVRIAKSADKDIQVLPSEIRRRVEDAIQGLSSNPFPSGCKNCKASITVGGCVSASIASFTAWTLSKALCGLKKFA
ncbi:MAG: hypothetical protein LKKZDAJK_000782 [Candidatus Fervidibacter sp.]